MRTLQSLFTLSLPRNLKLGTKCGQLSIGQLGTHENELYRKDIYFHSARGMIHINKAIGLCKPKAHHRNKGKHHNHNQQTSTLAHKYAPSTEHRLETGSTAAA